MFINHCTQSSLGCLPCSSVQLSRSTVSDSLRPHELQHTRPPCPSPSPGVHSKSCPLSWWCHPAISSSVVLFSSCPQSLPVWKSFPMSQLFAWENLEIELPYDPAIPLLGIYTKEIRIERDTCTPMFTVALCMLARTWKPNSDLNWRKWGKPLDHSRMT